MAYATFDDTSVSVMRVPLYVLPRTQNHQYTQHHEIRYPKVGGGPIDFGRNRLNLLTLSSTSYVSRELGYCLHTQHKILNHWLKVDPHPQRHYCVDTVVPLHPRMGKSVSVCYVTIYMGDIPR